MTIKKYSRSKKNVSLYLSPEIDRKLDELAKKHKSKKSLVAEHLLTVTVDAVNAAGYSPYAPIVVTVGDQPTRSERLIVDDIRAIKTKPLIPVDNNGPKIFRIKQ